MLFAPTRLAAAPSPTHVHRGAAAAAAARRRRPALAEWPCAPRSRARLCLGRRAGGTSLPQARRPRVHPLPGQSSPQTPNRHSRKPGNASCVRACFRVSVEAKLIFSHAPPTRRATPAAPAVRGAPGDRGQPPADSNPPRRRARAAPRRRRAVNPPPSVGTFAACGGARAGGAPAIYRFLASPRSPLGAPWQRRPCFLRPLPPYIPASPELGNLPAV
ncbi:MAG: hypothetical protein J3K34DRAFT_424614 [Monoraphidium minutum]|nr:MAG: hypothetical protein J3K34DRAFT_424614 [Monoraphidium minutum]